MWPTLHFTFSLQRFKDPWTQRPITCFTLECPVWDFNFASRFVPKTTVGQTSLKSRTNSKTFHSTCIYFFLDINDFFIQMTEVVLLHVNGCILYLGFFSTLSSKLHILKSCLHHLFGMFFSSLASSAGKRPCLHCLKPPVFVHIDVEGGPDALTAL